MPIQRVLLRVTLILLAVAAFAAIAAVMGGSSVLLWRVVLSCVEAAIATYVMLRVSRLLPRPETRPAAFLGLGCLIVSFCLFLFCTWMGLFAVPAGDQLWGTTFAIACAGGVATCGLAMRGREQWQWAALAIPAVTGVSLIALLAAIWTESAHLGQSVATAAPMLILAAACLVGRSPMDRPWRFLGILFALAAAVIGPIASFQIRPVPDAWNLYTALVAGAIAVTHANLLMLLPLPAPWPVFRMATIAAAVAAALGVAFAAFASPDLGWDLLSHPTGRITAAATILAACGTLALVARERLGRRLGPIHSAKTTFDHVALTCPRCGTKQNAPVGASPCIHCRLILSVHVGEPRCPACEYCLFDLTEDRCPECGHAIPARGSVIPRDPDAGVRT